MTRRQLILKTWLFPLAVAAIVDVQAAWSADAEVPQALLKSLDSRVSDMVKLFNAGDKKGFLALFHPGVPNYPFYRERYKSITSRKLKESKLYEDNKSLVLVYTIEVTGAHPGPMEVFFGKEGDDWHPKDFAIEFGG